MSRGTPMTPERWEHTSAYLRDVFARTDERHASVMTRALAAGLPEIDAGPATGRFLQVLCTMLRARLVIEVGTLAGYSAMWLARGLASEGRVISVEVSATHAAFAQKELADAGMSERVSIRQGLGQEVLPVLLRELGPESADVIFFDARRSEYLGMLDTAHALLRCGGVLAIDNALAAERWTADPVPAGQAPDVMDTVNRAIAGDERFCSVVVPIGNGILVASKRAGAPGGGRATP